MRVPRFIVAQAIAALFVSVASAAASAQPVLYRIKSLSSSAYLEGPLPAAVHAPISMPTSAPQPITEVPNPLIVTAAWRAQLGESAVMITPVALMPKASANVSSMEMPFAFIVSWPWSVAR